MSRKISNFVIRIHVNMKVRFYHWYNAVLAALLGLLGFESCDGGGFNLAEYGCWWTEYQVKGTVTDETGKPIPDIQIKLAEHLEDIDSEGKRNIYHRGHDTIQTDKQGKYQTKVVSDMNCITSALKVIIEDVDGSANGGDFQSDTLTMPNLEKKIVKKADGSFMGRYEVKGDVTLKTKTEN